MKKSKVYTNVAAKKKEHKINEKKGYFIRNCLTGKRSRRRALFKVENFIKCEDVRRCASVE